MKSRLYTWALLILPPLFFLFGLIVLVALYSKESLNETAFSERITDNIPYLLFYAQVFMLFLLLIYSKVHAANIVLDTFKSPTLVKDLSLGVLLGSLLALCYFKFGILEGITHLQRTFGDYVPTGETSNSVSKNLSIFFIANVLLAPFVEENIYRNIAFRNLRQKYSGTTTVIVTSLMFGLLHWVGGFWYILITGILVGIPFGIVQLKKETILLVFTAHFSLNLIEFILSLD
ncbi:MAG: lysostaphin resistance A-like protein [Cytophagaceae bacterium]